MSTMEIFGWTLAVVSLATLIRWAWKRAGQDRAAMYAQGGEVVPHGKANVVPIDDLLDHNEPDAMRAREQETRELEDLLKLPAFERGQA